VLVNLLFAHRAEQRVADYVFLPITTVGDVGTPDAAAMDAYYKAHAQAFTAPEYRSFTVLALTDSAVSASITIPDATLRDLYQQHQDEYSLPEQRDVENIVLPDEATTKKATDALAKGEDFYAVAKRLANEDKDALDLGWVSRKDLPTEMGDFVFAAKQGATSQGIHTDFGWSILRVKDIRPPHIVPYEEAKPKLDAEARHDAAANALYTLSNKVEDAVAGGADMKAIAQQFNLKPFSVDMIDQNGIRPSGVAVTGLPVATADLAKTAFATQAGQSSDLTQTNDGKFFMLHVDKVSPPTPRPFAEVKDQVKAAWIKDRQNEKLDSMTADLVKTVKGGTKLADLAKARHLTLATSKPFGHDGDFSGGLPANMTATLFNVPLGTVTSARGLQDNVDGAYIGVLTKIMPADAKANAVGAQQVKQQLNADIGGELITEFSQALRRDYPVLVNQTALDRLY
jgi:peptidyl-prolyl cis-trans isomerase D